MLMETFYIRLADWCKRQTKIFVSINLSYALEWHLLILKLKKNPMNLLECSQGTIEKKKLTQYSILKLLW